MTSTYPAVYTIAESAGMLGVSIEWLEMAVARRRVRCIHLCGTVRFTDVMLDEARADPGLRVIRAAGRRAEWLHGHRGSS